MTGWRAGPLARSAARAVPWALAAAALLVLATFPRWTADDAYILLRYAENLARHGELTWNVGEDPVEGYTGVLLATLLAAAARAGASAWIAAKVLGVVAAALGAWVLFRLLAELRVRRGVALVAVAAYATGPEVYVHALGGLETTIFATLVGASALALAVAAARPSPAHERAAIAVALATSLTRPEGVVCAAVVAAGVAIARARAGAGLRAFAARFVIGFVAPGAAYFAWRWRYYGRPLPNTFYAKTAMPWVVHEFGKSFERFADDYLGSLAFAALALVLAAAVVAPRALARRLAARRWEALALVALVGPPFAIYARSFLAMDYWQRFCFHDVLPLLAALAVVASDALGVLVDAAAAEPLRARVAIALAALLGVAQPFGNLSRLPLAREFARNYAALLEHEHARAGAWLRDHLPPGSRVASYLDAGIVAWISGLPVVDFGRLNDEYLTTPGLGQEQLVDYFFANDPAALVVTSYSDQELRYEADAQAIVRDPRFARYKLVEVFSTDDPPVPDCEMLFVREDQLGATTR